MGSIVDSLRENLILVFFVYGLAFFVMGLAIALENKRLSGLKLAASLSFLAVFGLTHAIVEWADMFMLIRTQALGLDEGVPRYIPLDVMYRGVHFHAIKMLLLPLSAAFLVQFGASLIANTLGRLSWLKWASFALLAVWAFAVAVSWFVGQVSVQECLILGDILARYLLYLPGSALAAIGIALQRGVLRSLDLPHAARDCLRASLALGLNGILAGLIVPTASFLPASVLNYENFIAWAEFPPQVFRALVALAIAYFVVRVLRIFGVEQARKLENAYQQRLMAQQEALEAQRQIHQAKDLWTKELEERVEQRTREIARRNHELSALNAVAQSITQSWSLDEVLNKTLGQILDFTGAQAGGFALVDRQSGQRTLKVCRGASSEMLSRLLCLAAEGDATVSSRLSASLFEGRVRNAPAPVEPEESREAELETHTMISVPLASKDKVLGSLILVKAGQESFTGDDLSLLTSLGHQIAMAIENARLLDQVQNLAVLGERDRIAREMHDGLSQVFGYLNLHTHAVEQMLGKARMAEVQEEIRQMRKLLQEAYADVREAILSLRTDVASGRGLLPTLSEYLEEFGKQAKIPVELVVADGVPADFPSALEVQLVRIVQEALTNVRKHTRATMAWVKLEADADEAVVIVEDNGEGFNAKEMVGQEKQHFGLQTMRERAESVGGMLVVESEVGKGTRVIVRLPKEPKETEGGQTVYGAYARSVGR